MPRLWTETIQTHRREVREAILDATAALVAERGLLSVTMSQIAETTGIGRATLYKYFPDVEAIMIAWHERQISNHMHQLVTLPDPASSPGEQLAAVLEGYAVMSTQEHGTELSAILHHGEHLVRARKHLSDYVRTLIVAAVRNGEVRDDIAPDELVSYCLHALQAASELPDQAAVHRLVEITLAGLKRTLFTRTNGSLRRYPSPATLTVSNLSLTSGDQTIDNGV